VSNIRVWTRVETMARGALLAAIPLSIFLVVLSWLSGPLDTDTIGLIVVIVAVAVVLIADKLRRRKEQ
jgi:membrane protein implicated in regulation of membrane protease activity